MEEQNTSNEITEKKQGSNTVIGLIIVLVVLVIGGILLSKDKDDQKMMQNENMTAEEQMIIDDVATGQPVLTQDTDTATLEQELNATTFTDLETDLKALDTELAQ